MALRTMIARTIKNRRTDEKFYEKFDLAVEVAVKKDIDTALKVSRVRRRKQMPGEASTDEPVQDPKQRFKSQVYFAICDRFIGELTNRFKDFNQFVQKFYCLLPRSSFKI